jgi:hypothetical protein
LFADAEPLDGVDAFLAFDPAIARGRVEARIGRVEDSGSRIDDDGKNSKKRAER